ncbi:non-ribosomal peptide synthetase [Pseudoalteromonas umbrosa]|uniref:non-ribosomal peptide synthetase n=1 Tax=Pseudoalteromonas umbrosa TaxID=3048489 RepID=UPI0024C2BFEF|nr:non-ribosomal peptide synthetase [Pseudoalteromonas sp. B95]MDK1288846.1 amino acid adenylation domain-containing protein [Pseudoalteromonas sp. B95]
MTEKSSFGLSLAQREVYLDQIMLPGSPAYNVGGYIDFDAVNTNRLIKAHAALVEKEEMFGLRVTATGALVEQYFVPSSQRDATIETIDFSVSSEAQIQKWVEAQFSIPFEVHDSQLFKAFILLLPNQKVQYLVIAHHLMMDGWGFANWAARINDYYDDDSYQPQYNGKWCDVVSTDENYTNSKRFEKDKAYWQAHDALNNASFLEAFYPKPLNGIDKSIRISKTLPVDITEQVNAFCAAQSLSAGQFYLAALSAYFCQAYEMQQLNIGLPLHNRRTFEQKNMLGMFTTITPLAVSVEPQWQLTDLIDAINKSQKRDWRHQRLPISQLASYAAQSRLYDVAFSYLKLDSRLKFEGTDASINYVAHNHEKTPLMVTVWDYGNDGRVTFHADINLAFFSELEGHAILERYSQYIAGLISQPSSTLQQHSVLSSEELKALQDSFAPALIKSHTGVLDYFNEQVLLNPNAVAVNHGISQWTYAELDERANEIAGFLAQSSVMPQQCIGVYMDRTPEMVASLLAIWKVGAVYVPLDTAYPQERLDLIIEDCDLALVLVDTQASTVNFDFKNYAYVRDICTQQSFSIHAAKSTDVSHLIYTSGSTGKPKGVQIAQANIVSLVEWAKEYFMPEQLHNTLASTSINFDLSVFELFVPLSLGHQITLVDNALELLETSQFNRDITLVNTVPSAIQALIRNKAIPNSVVTFNIAGEPLASKLVNDIFSQFPNCTVNNLYGPSEDTTYSTAKQFTGPITQKPSIGKAINGTQSYVVSEAGNLVPNGVSGELYLSGEGLSKGYLNRPELNKEKFITPEFLGGKKAYRTGDIVRVKDNGELDYLGRKDEQVKVSGFRIELGEINSQLAALELVDEAITVAQTEGEHAVLVAYVVLATNEECSANEILQALGNTLPSHMIPSELYVVEAMPLLPNGKVNKKALEAFRSITPLASETACQGETELKLAGLWQALLSCPIESIGASSSFFELGGRSILYASLLAEINDLFSIELSFSELFSCTNLRALAVLIDAAERHEKRDITPVPAAQRVSLSVAQQQIWLQQQVHGDVRQYHMPVALQLKGKVDEHAVQAALNVLLEQHQVLRTVYVEELGEVSQIVKQYEPLQVQSQILTTYADSKAEFERRAVQDIEQPFILSEDCMVRATLYRLSDEDTILLLVFHHIAIDGTAIQLLLNEFTDHYQKITMGAELTATDQGVQFRDFCNWKSKQNNAARTEAGIAFFQQVLNAAPQHHSLPSTQNGEMAKQSGRCISHIESTDIETIRTLSTQLKTSEFDIIHAILAILFTKVSQVDDVVIGCPVANRLEIESQKMIGCFVNMLPLRAKVDKDARFDNFVQKLSKQNQAALSYQDVPFASLVKALAPESNTGISPIFQLMLSVEENNTGLTKSATQDERWTLIDLNWGKALFDIELRVRQSAAQWELEWVFAADKFNSVFIEKLTTQFKYLIAQLADKQTQPIAALALSNMQQLDEAKGALQNKTAIQQPASSILSLLDTSRYTDSCALQVAGTELSYADLQRMADKVTSALLSAGVCIGDRVGLLLERDAWLVPTIVGVMKAGATFVPLDPQYPEHRLAHMMADSDMAYVITHQAGQVCIPESCQVILTSEISGIQPVEVSTQVSPQMPAYIMYTSGSTGTPKGVVVSHQALAAHMESVISTLALSVEDVVLQIASFSFDTFLEQTLASLCSGSKLYMTDSSRLSSVQFFTLLSEQKISVVDMPVAYLSLWLDAQHAPQWQASSLRKVYVGGEALPLEAVRNWFSYGPAAHCELYNAYGPTEAVITSTLHCVQPNDTHGVPIGKVFGERMLAVLDDAQSWCEPGVVGELYIGGVAIADGYWKKPTQTADSFVQLDTKLGPCTFYKSGDRVWYDDSGTLYYVGRQDQQLQLNGIRIELAEVEYGLSQLEHVQSLKVCLKGNTSPRLVAYVIPTSTAFDPQHFLSAAANVLPSYSVPSQCVVIDTWPLTANGKICLDSLPEPEVSLSENAALPSTEVERSLQQHFGELLERSATTIGIDDSFFSLGGNSLTLLKLSAIVHAQWGVQLTLSEIFSKPTIRALASEIEASSVQQAKIIEIPKISADLAPASSQQRRIWLQHQLAGTKAYSFNMYKAMSVQGNVSESMLKAALNALWHRHTVLKSRFVSEHNMLRVAEHADANMPITLLDFSMSSDMAEHALQQQIDLNANKVFDLNNEPPIHCSLIKMRDDKWVILVNMHHIVSDGWSVQIFEREFIELCRAYLQPASQRSELQPLPIEYRDFAAFQSQHAETDKDKIDFWVTQLNDAPVSHDLPLEFERPATPKGEGRLLKHSFAPQTSTQIEAFCKTQGITPFVFLQTAFALYVAKESNAQDVVIGTPVANRELTQVEPLVGCFMNMVALRSQFDFNDSFNTLVDKNKQRIFDVFSHQNVPFEEVVDALNPPRLTQITPIFQLAFIYHERHAELPKIPGVILDTLELEQCGAKYDITLNVEAISDGLQCVWEYDTGLFSSTRIKQMAENFESVIANVLDNPAAPVSSISTLSASRQQVVLQAGIGEALSLPEVNGVYELIDSVANSHPDRVAIEDTDKSITYNALMRRSNQLAHALRAKGITAGDTVGVRLAPSIELVISLLAIMKLNATYVPLDVEIASGRLAKITADSEFKLILANHNESDSLLTCSLSTLELSEFADTTPQLTQRSLSDCAYTLYTSGSTGTPKGVQISHGALLNFICSMSAKPGINASDRVLAMTAPTFDISGLELFLPLCYGAQLLFDDLAYKLDGEQLGNLLAQRQATVFQSTPVVWRLLLESGWQGNNKLKALCGGEALAEDLATKLAPKVNQLWNMYGPTETTIWSTCAQIMSHENALGACVNIGKPIHNTQVFILDSDLNPVPFGSKGQIYIGGDGLALGYLNLPEVNAKAFICEQNLPSHIHQLGVNRLYATGDLGFVTDEGVLHHLGRIDNQIKLRGFRIEPGEIESAINQYKGVNDSLVLVDNDKLVAFCAIGHNEVTEKEIKTSLQNELPHYMQPQVIVMLPEFPLTSSGKKDRKQLPNPFAMAQTVPQTSYHLESDSEKLIAEILRDILSIANLDPEVSFFDLGANSMDLVTLTQKLSERINQKLSPVDAFQFPSIRSFAQFLDSKGERVKETDRKEQLSAAKNRLKRRKNRKSKHDKASIS